MPLCRCLDHCTRGLGRSVVVYLFAIFICEFSLPAQDSTRPNTQESLASIQRQIDELKQGQQLILRELQEIKKSLPEKPVRIDSMARPELPHLVSLNLHGEPFRGDAKARIGMVEYSDFDCSFCAKYANDIYPRIDLEYIKPGKIKYFFHDLPAPGETNALLKARAARCAGEQGKFWEMHDLLFTAPSTPLELNLTLQAQTLGLDLEKLNQCLSSGTYAENIQRSASAAARMGILGTPAFVIGTLSEGGDFLMSTNILVGAENYNTLKSVLDTLLTAHPTNTPANRL